MNQVTSPAASLIEQAQSFASCVEFLESYHHTLRALTQARRDEITAQSQLDWEQAVTAEGFLAAQRRRDDRLTALSLTVDFRVGMHHQACEMVHLYTEKPSPMALGMLKSAVSFLKDPL